MTTNRKPEFPAIDYRAKPGLYVIAGPGNSLGSNNAYMLNLSPEKK